MLPLVNNKEILQIISRQLEVKKKNTTLTGLPVVVYPCFVHEIDADSRSIPMMKSHGQADEEEETWMQLLIL